jgi:hypothetical protein
MEKEMKERIGFYFYEIQAARSRCPCTISYNTKETCFDYFVVISTYR